MNPRHVIDLLIIACLVIIQVSFLTTWPAPVNSIHLLLSVLMFLSIVSSHEKALWWALAGGIFFELFSTDIFGMITFSLIATLFLINLLFSNFFTNRSLYSLLSLGTIGTIFYNLVITGFRWIEGSYFNLSKAILINETYFYEIIYQVILNDLAMLIIFLIYRVTTGKLRTNLFVRYS